jgi:hypothetical protein
MTARSRWPSELDHIAVTRAGVWVIDTKRYPEKKVEFRNGGGMFRTDERLIVGGRDQTKLVDAMGWQVEPVVKVIREVDPEVDVKPMLCFVDSTWGWFAKPLVVRGVVICWPAVLPALLGAQGPIDVRDVQRLAKHLASSLEQA